MKKEISITQKEVIDFSLHSLYYNNQVYIDMEMGMGKTLTALELLKEMVGESGKKILYICPTGLIPQVSKVAASSYPSLSIEFRQFGWFQNLEFVRSQLTLAANYAIVIVDEAHKIKSFSNSILSQEERDLDYLIDLKKINEKKFPYTLVSVGVLAFIKNIKYRVFMSGTAMPLGAIDIFNFLWLGKHKLISNPYSRQSSFLSFAENFCIKKQTPQGTTYSGFKKSTYPKLLESIKDCYIRKEHKDEKTESLKIPDPVYTLVEIAHTESYLQEEERIIDILRKHYNITPENFLQILKTTPQFAQVMTLRRAVGIAKIQEVLKFVDKIGRKAIYFFQFKEASHLFFREMEKRFKNVFHVTGEMNKNKTAKIIDLANNLEESIIVATMGKAGTGFDCPGFQKIAFVELDMNFALVEQARGRILRKGIKHTPYVYFFITPGGVDEMVVKNLKGKNFKYLEGNK